MIHYADPKQGIRVFTSLPRPDLTSRGVEREARSPARVREREEKKEREREVVGGQKERFFAYRDVIQITSRLRQRNFWLISYYRCALRDVIRITSRKVKKAQNPA
jgi:hypothetical protein